MMPGNNDSYHSYKKYDQFKRKSVGLVKETLGSEQSEIFFLAPQDESILNRYERLNLKWEKSSEHKSQIHRQNQSPGGADSEKNDTSRRELSNLLEIQQQLQQQ